MFYFSHWNEYAEVTPIHKKDDKTDKESYSA